MSDGNDLIEEQIKMKMSDGMFQNKHTKRLFKPFFFFFFFLFFFFFFSFFLLSFSPFFSFSPCFLSPHPPSTQNLLYLTLMMSILVIMGVIVLMMIVVEGDDTQALRDTISSLCSLNSVGKFASCCVSYDNGASLTLASSTARNCFISGLGSTRGSVLTSLFVICSFCFVPSF